MSHAITIREAHSSDAPDLRRLAALDDRPALDGNVLMAVVGGEPLAALSVTDGRAAADPFHRTKELVELLRLRAAQAR